MAIAAANQCASLASRSTRARHFWHRVVGKLIGWYIEPSWQAQANFDELGADVINLLVRWVTQCTEELRNIRDRIDIWEAEGMTRDDMAVMRNELSNLLERLNLASSAHADIDYSSFEDQFRGEQEDLRTAQQWYVQWLPLR